MEQIITIQDAYIAKVLRYDPTGYNFAALRTKAAKKLRQALLTLGFTAGQAQAMLMDANDVVTLEREAR